MLKMKASPEAYAVIKFYEKLRLTPYKATPAEKFYTGGYGHYSAALRPGMVITEAMADQWLHEDVAAVEAVINKYAHPSITQPMFDALVDLGFNNGTGAFIPDSVKNDFDDALRAGDWAKVRATIPDFRNQRINGKLVPLLGLVRRRATDVALFDGRSGQVAIGIGQNVKSIK